eukprot:gene11905-11998_t
MAGALRLLNLISIIERKHEVNELDPLSRAIINIVTERELDGRMSTAEDIYNLANVSKATVYRRIGTLISNGSLMETWKNQKLTYQIGNKMKAFSVDMAEPALISIGYPPIQINHIDRGAPLSRTGSKQLAAVIKISVALIAMQAWHRAPDMPFSKLQNRFLKEDHLLIPGYPGWPLVLFIALAYYLAGRLGLLLAISPGYATVIWPSAGIALSAVVLKGRRVWWGIVLGSFLINIGLQFDGGALRLSWQSLLLPLLIGAAAALQALVGAKLMERFHAFPYARIELKSIVRLFVFGGLVSGLVNSTIATVLLFAVGQLSLVQFVTSWGTWWAGDTLGIFVFAPLILGILAVPADKRWRRAVPIVLPSLSALIITIFLFALNTGSSKRNIEAEFSILTREFGNRIEATIDLCTHAVGGLAGLFDGSPDRNFSDFQHVASQITAFGLGIQALEWIPRVSDTERPAFERKIAAQLNRNFLVFERVSGQEQPASQRPAYFPVTYVAPLKGNEGAVGFDLASNETRNASLVEAERTAKAVATPGLTLVQNGKTGVLMFLPVFDSARPVTTEQERHDALKGFVLGVFAVSDLLNIALQGHDISDVGFWLVDVTDAASPKILTSNDREKPISYSSEGEPVFEKALPVGEHVQLGVGGRKWAFWMAPTDAYLIRHGDSSAYYILLAGLLFTALLSGMMLLATNRQYQMVASKEKALEDQKFALDQHAIVSITDIDGVIQYANDRFVKVSGYPREYLLGKSHNIVHSFSHEPEFFEDMWTNILSGKVWHGEVCNRNASGEFYWLDSTIVPLLDQNKQPVQFIAICTDITARKRLEGDLETSRAFLQSVTDSMGEGIYTLDANGICTFLNAEGERLIGWTAEEVMNRHIHDIVHFQDNHGTHIPMNECAIMCALRQGDKYYSEDQYFTRRDGHVFPVSVTSVRLLGGDHFTGSVTVFQDITERRRIQDELRKSEERLSIALNASGTGLWDVYPQAQLAIFSDTWFTMLGYAPNSFAPNDESFRALMHPDDLPSFELALKEHIDGLRPLIEAEFRMRRSDGSWAYIKSIGKVIDRDENNAPSRVVGVHIDISAAHQTQQRDYLAKLQTASRALLDIINDILDFSKIEAGKFNIETVEFNIDTVLDNLTAMIAPKIREKGLELVIARAPELPVKFLGDPLRLSQILMNLLSNATKFTQAGEVLVTVGGHATSDAQFMLEIAVSDSGIGMSPDQIAMLFKPFMQADASISRRFGGTGLGLAICHQLVVLLGGVINVESTKGQGSTFSFSLPLTRVQDKGLNSDVDHVLQHKRVLVVDDSNAVRSILANMLGYLEAHVSLASNGEEALMQLEQDEPFDLIVLDWKMPSMDGLEFLHRLNAKAGKIPLLMTTAYGVEALEAAIEQEHMGYLVAGVIEKPISSTVLQEWVRVALGYSSLAVKTEAGQRRRASDIILTDAEILLVEDNPINQQVATELLEVLGIVVTIASSGEVAIAILRSRQFDLILMDIQMPGMDGFATTTAIRSDLGIISTPIIAMTANAMSGDRERCIDAGMNDHIAKPIDPDNLALTLARWLESDVAYKNKRIIRGFGSTTSDPHDLPLNLPGLDFSLALKNTNGNKALLIRLLQEFEREYGYDAMLARDLMTQPDWPLLHHLSHTLRGTASTLGAVTVGHIAGKLEELTVPDTQDMPKPQVFILFEELKAALLDVSKSIQSLASPSSTMSPSKGPLKLDLDEINAAVSRLSVLLKEGDSDAEHQSEHLIQLLWDTKGHKLASDIARLAGMSSASLARILVVDDEPINVKILVDLLRPTYSLVVAKDGAQALERLRGETAIDLVLLDVMMPEMDGLAVCRQIKNDPRTIDIPVIFISALGTTHDEMQGFELGAVDYITKPISPSIVLARVATHIALRRARQVLSAQNISLEQLVAERTHELALTQDVTITALASLAETRDNETGYHLRRTQFFVKRLAEELRHHPHYTEQLTDRTIELMYKSAPLHDIGKVGIPDSILLKPGPLTHDEYELMKTHPVLGQQALQAAIEEGSKPTEFLLFAIEICGYHHEKWDGTGYPKGFSKDQIPLSAQLMALADVYDALVSRRVYKPALSHEEAIKIIESGSGKHFNPVIVSAFSRCKADFKTISDNYPDQS